MCLSNNYNPRHEKTCFMLYANNKNADQRLCFRCLDSIIPILAISRIQILKTLAGLCSWSGRFESYLVAKPRRQVFS